MKIHFRFTNCLKKQRILFDLGKNNDGNWFLALNLYLDGKLKNMKNILTCLVLLLTAVNFTKNVSAQEVYSDATLGYTMTIPNGWTYQTFESGETAITVTADDGISVYSLILRKLSTEQTAYDYLLYLESYMPAAGYSENNVPDGSRFFTGEDAAFYKADDVACGVYTAVKNDVKMMQSIIVYRSGMYLYMTVATCSVDSYTALEAGFNLLNSTFKLL